MTNRNNRTEWMWTMAAGLAVVPMTMSGCSKPPPPPPPPAPTYVPPPPPPAQADVVALLQEMDADKRVQFPEEMAPIDVEYARAIIQFASSFAQGDEEALGGMLDMEARGTLNEMVESGAWYDETDAIEAIRVVYLTDPVEGDEESFEMGGIGAPDDLRGTMESLMSGEMTAEVMRDQALAEIRDEGLTSQDIMDRMFEQSMGGLGEGAGSLEDMSAEERQMAETMFGADVIATMQTLETAMAALETEFAQGNMTPEDLVNTMYDRGIFQQMVDMMSGMAGGLGGMMEQVMDEAFGGMGEGMEGMDTLGSSFNMSSGDADLRLAIQKPGAAFALSFTAHRVGDGFIFSPAPELGDIRVRASDFTGKSAGLGSFGDQLGGLDFGNDFGNPDGTPNDGNSTQGGGGPSPTRPNVPTGPGPSSPGG